MSQPPGQLPGGLVAERMVVRVLSTPLAEPVPMSFSALTARRSLLVELHAGGHVGVGESWVNYPEWAATERVATLLEGVAPLVLGSDVADPAVTTARLQRALEGLARQWGAPGPVWQAISAVDLAAWDLRGRVAGCPTGDLLAEMSGVPARRPAPAYASGVGPTRVPELCERALELGLRAVKAKVGFGHDVDRATIATIRACAPEVAVFADANCAWEPAEARRQAEVLAAEGVQWLEEPLREGSPAALADLHAATGLPLAAGENVYGLRDLQVLAATPGVAHVQPDPAKSGGISTAVALQTHLPATCLLSPHWYAGAVGLRAAQALVSAQRHQGWLELDVRPNPLRERLLTAGFPLRDGLVLAATSDGLTADLDHDVIAALQVFTDERNAA